MSKSDNLHKKGKKTRHHAQSGADVGGVCNSQWIMAVSRWVTTIYKSSKPLPRTGY